MTVASPWRIWRHHESENYNSRLSHWTFLLTRAFTRAPGGRSPGHRRRKRRTPRGARSNRHVRRATCAPYPRRCAPPRAWGTGTRRSRCSRRPPCPASHPSWNRSHCRLHPNIFIKASTIACLHPQQPIGAYAIRLCTKSRRTKLVEGNYPTNS